MSLSLPGLGALLQPQVLVAGLLTGVVGGTVGVATGAIPVTDPQPRQQVLYACPDGVRAVTSVAPDAKVLVVARSADGQWLELYVGTPRVDYAWAPVSALHLPAAPDTLPIDDCTPDEVIPPPAPPASLPPPTEAPSASSVTSPSPTPRASASIGPSPTPAPTPTPVPTPPPTPNTGPSLAQLTIESVPEDPPGSGIYPIYPSVTCPYTLPTYASFSVYASDPDGVASVTLYYQPLGGSVMTTDLGDEGEGLYYGYFDTSSDWAYGEIEYWVQAVDGIGDVSVELHGDNAHHLVLTDCGE